MSNIKKLNYLFDEYGTKSTEFYEFCYPFICYILNRKVHGEVEEDLINECYIKVCYALDNYFRPEKGNIGTFVFTVVQNRIKSYYHKENRRLKSECFTNEEYCFGYESSQIVMDLQKVLDFEFLTQNFKFLSVDVQALSLVTENIFKKERSDHLLYKAANWEYLSSN